MCCTGRWFPEAHLSPVSSLGRCVGRLRLRVESQGPRGRSAAGCAAQFSVVLHSYRWEGGALELRAARIQGCFSVAGWGCCVKDTYRIRPSDNCAAPAGVEASRDLVLAVRQYLRAGGFLAWRVVCYPLACAAYLSCIARRRSGGTHAQVPVRRPRRWCAARSRSR